MLIVACIVYATAMIAANAIVGHFGPWVSPINSFILIGLELSLRDWLHFRLRQWQMGILITVGGLLTWGLNAAPAQIAIASAVAFVCSAMIDWGVFSALWRRPWLVRSNASNTAGALADSILFPTIAFGAFMPHIVLLQFAAKVGGGFLWSLILRKMALMPRELVYNKKQRTIVSARGEP